VICALTWSSPPLEPPLVTVIVALDETRCSSATATSVYVVVALGETVFEPLRYTWTPSRYTVLAPLVVQVRVDDCPALIVVGDAVSCAVSEPPSSS
jgi:hypothetical protein